VGQITGMSSFIPFGNAGLFDEFMQSLDVAAFETPLMRVGKIVKWQLFKPEVMASTLLVAKGPGGRPRFDPMLMFKILILQRLHTLADDATSFQITDRSSFRAFLGLTPADAVPDGQTISDFRAQLIKAGAMERLFNIFLEHLQKEHGLALAKQGVMVDATFVGVPKQRNNHEQNAQIKAGEVPQALLDKPKVRAHKDLDARWTIKNHERHYGYKDHVKVDVADKLILKGLVTTASVHDSQAIDALLDEGDRVVYADSAYSSDAIAAGLAAKNIETQINEKGGRAHPLNEQQLLSNREKSRIRSRVEHVFAQMAGTMHALRQRCIGMVRNAAGITMTNLVYNMLRFEQIKRLNLSFGA
jgi:IS5 family transposase